METNTWLILGVLVGLILVVIVLLLLEARYTRRMLINEVPYRLPLRLRLRGWRPCSEDISHEEHFEVTVWIDHRLSPPTGGLVKIARLSNKDIWETMG